VTVGSSGVAVHAEVTVGSGVAVRIITAAVNSSANSTANSVVDSAASPCSTRTCYNDYS
jgi:hypothetical protein